VISQEIMSNVDNLIQCKKNKCKECKEDLSELRKRIIEWDGSKSGSRTGSLEGSLSGGRDVTAGGVDVSICKICGKNKKLLNGWCHDCWDKYLAEELG